MAQLDGSLPFPMSGIPAPTAGTAALVTGASAGIGVEIAKELAGRGHNVVLVARREERLRALATELEESNGIRAVPIACDLTDPSARARLTAQVEELGLEVSVLVNNAGFGTAGPFLEQDLNAEIDQVRILCEAVVDLTHRFAPAMVERGCGAILTTASTSGFQPLPNTVGYGAAKAWAVSFSESLHEELRHHGIAVTASCPGPVHTEFFEVSGPHPVETIFPKFAFISAERCARDSVKALDRNKRVIVPGVFPFRMAMHGNRFVPHGALLPVMGRVFKSR
jgi:uncharacterized protein